MKKRMYKIMALAMTAAMVVPMAAQTTAFAADDKEITYWNIAVESPDKDIVTAAVDRNRVRLYCKFGSYPERYIQGKTCYRDELR